MFKFRQLAAGIAVSLGLAGAAQPLFAQSVTDFVKDEPVKKTKKSVKVDDFDKDESKSAGAYNLDSLERQLKGQFKVVESYGKGDTRSFTVPKLNYSLRSREETVSWTVDFNIIKRGDKQVVRMYFNCQTMPENVNTDRLKQLMWWSGGHATSTAYYKTLPNGKQEQLYLVADYQLEAAPTIDWQKEIDKLFLMADDTLHLWSGDLSKPVAQKPTKDDTSKKTTKAKEKDADTEELDINGGWDGKVMIDDEEVGQYSMQFMDGVIIASRARKGVDSVSMLTGSYSLDGNKLTIEYKEVEKPETYTVAIEGKTLTLTSKKGDNVMTIKMKKSR